MTHLPNKHFNSYKEGLDLEFLRAYCMEYGERRSFERGETLEEAGRAGVVGGPTWRGCFKYVTRGYWLQQGWHQNASRATFLMAVYYPNIILNLTGMFMIFYLVVFR